MLVNGLLRLQYRYYINYYIDSEGTDYSLVNFIVNIRALHIDIAQYFTVAIVTFFDEIQATFQN